METNIVFKCQCGYEHVFCCSMDGFYVRMPCIGCDKEFILGTENRVSAEQDKEKYLTGDVQRKFSLNRN